MNAPGHLDASTVEWCERCRCKTWHVVDRATGERLCEWHRHPALHGSSTEKAAMEASPERRATPDH